MSLSWRWQRRPGRAPSKGNLRQPRRLCSTSLGVTPPCAFRSSVDSCTPSCTRPLANGPDAGATRGDGMGGCRGRRAGGVGRGCNRTADSQIRGRSGCSPRAPEYRLRSRNVPHVVRVRSPCLPQQHASDAVVQRYPHAPETDRRYVWSHARIAVDGCVRTVTSADRALLHSGDGRDRTPTCDLSHVRVVVLVMPKKVEETMAYQAEISRKNPGCFLFLVDQSESMEDPFGGGEAGRRKAEELATILNKLIHNLCIRCSKSDSIYDYFHVGVLGYSEDSCK